MVIQLPDRVLDGFDGTGTNGLAGWLRRERHRLLGERVDTLPCRASGLLSHDELCETWAGEGAVLLQFLVTDVGQSAQNRVYLLSDSIVTLYVGERFVKRTL